MKIKRLEIVGFKSFVDKVTLDFQHGITGVVGPNGCGKSNIVDALRWVMGEQNARQLRGRMMEDIIFGGSETRKPHGLAQVSVVFDNSAGLCPPAYRDYAEIMVTRCLHRSGESEYLINKTPCRLLDITELFMDTGVGARAYSIIEQGKVGMLVSAKAEDRRMLIEEVAGVTKFKSRKKSAERKMEATKQNLVRLGDVIAEVRRRISSLKRQAQQAEKYRDYRGEMRRIELSLTGNRFQALNGEESVVAEQERKQTGILQRLDGRLEESDLQLSEKQLQLSAAEAAFATAQEGVYQLGAEVQRVENELVVSRRQQEHFVQQQQDLQLEQDSLALKMGSLQSEQAEIRRENAEAVQRLEILCESVAAADTENEQIVSRERQLSAQYENRRGELMELYAQVNRLGNRREEISRRLTSEEQRRGQISRNSAKLEEQRQRLLEEREALLHKIEQLRVQQEEHGAAMKLLEQRYQEKKYTLKKKDSEQSDLRQALEKSRSRQESLQDLLLSREGFDEGTRVLLDGRTDWNCVVADIIRVDEQYETAVEVAMAERLQTLVSEHRADIAPALSLLSAQQVRASLLLSVPACTQVAFPPGTPLLSKVTAGKGYESLVAQLLSGIYYVADVGAFADQSLPPGLLLVDAENRCLDWRGVMFAGSAVSSSSGLLRRQRQLTEVSAQTALLDQRFAGIAAEFADLEAEVLLLEEEKSSSIARSHLLELQSVELRKDRQKLQAEENSIGQRLALVVYDLEQIDDQQDRLKAEAQQLVDEMEKSAARQNELEETVEVLQRQLGTVRTELDRARELLTEKRVAYGSLQQQQTALKATLQRIEKQQEDLDQRRGEITQKHRSAAAAVENFRADDETLQTQLEVLLNRREEQQERTDLARQDYDRQRAGIDESREQQRQLRTEAEDVRKTVSRLQIRRHELQVEAEHVRQTVLDRYRVDLAEHRVPEATEDELERQRQQLQRLQQRVDALGEVNLMAIDEYREQEERYEFLSRQRDDLNQSLDDLQKAISQINRTTRRRFKETFDLVNDKFKRIFPRLFRGGQAELRLSDEHDLLETGIDIIVQPPGKRLQNVNLLSGGEKALTAVALIFSLFLIKPTPFCILDEVDAPLDDANIDRFAEMITEMTAQSQFIIITHSKRTMSIVDAMYGVTMQEAGVSKLVSVRLNDLHEPTAGVSVLPA